MKANIAQAEKEILIAEQTHTELMKDMYVLRDSIVSLVATHNKIVHSLLELEADINTEKIAVVAWKHMEE
jgi:hypothetical protein